MFLTRLTITFMLILACCTSAQADIFKLVTKQGDVTFSDRALHDGYVKLEKTWKGWQEPQANTNFHYYKKKYRHQINAAAKRYDLSPTLVRAVIHTESHYNPIAESKAGAVGLMQLMPATATRYGVYNRKNPEQNIDGGTRFLKDLMKSFDNDIELVLAAYNAGENAVKRYGNKIPPYPETERYVIKVLALYKEYELGNI